VAQTFRANDRPDPRLDQDGRTCFLLTEQFRGYRNQDGSKKKQKALPMFILKKMHDLASSNWEKAVVPLLIGAIFFAMRSCEYLETNSKEETRRTRIIRLRNITFKSKNNILLKAYDERLEEAELVMINFEYQKNDKRNVQVHMFSTKDKILNPVAAWAKVIKRVRSYPNSSMDTKVCSFIDKNIPSSIKADHVRSWLRSITELIGEAKLGFSKEDVGLHSIRSGAAMAMFMSGVSPIIIQRVGRWSSDAFLEYIRDQVESFTLGVSQKMIDADHFNHISSNIEKYPKLKILHNKNGPDQIPLISFSKRVLDQEDKEKSD
jgi:hypothetical protein